MADLMSEAGASPPTTEGRAPAASLAAASGYALSVLFVAAAAVLAFVAEQLIAPPNLSLIFVAPVVIAAAAFGLRPALVAGLAGVAVFDFFFLSPRYTLRVASPDDVWALVLLGVIAAVVSTVGARARRLGQAAERAAAQLEALQALAAAAAASPGAADLGQATAEALHRMFRAPVVVFARRELALRPVASAGSPVTTEAESAAARWALGAGLPVHAEAYPHDACRFDLWPVGAGLVVGVDFTRGSQARPPEAAGLVNLAASHLVAAERR